MFAQLPKQSWLSLLRAWMEQRAPARQCPVLGDRFPVACQRLIPCIDRGKQSRRKGWPYRPHHSRYFYLPRGTVIFAYGCPGTRNMHDWALYVRAYFSLQAGETLSLAWRMQTKRPVSWRRRTPLKISTALHCMMGILWSSQCQIPAVLDTVTVLRGHREDRLSLGHS